MIGERGGERRAPIVRPPPPARAAAESPRIHAAIRRMRIPGLPSESDLRRRRAIAARIRARRSR
ncbi:hypothetical protein WJ28_05190 [Burkholderia thailandensis]|nr:hypothetical protein WJ27_20010 [Burkholderia thailandensis]KVG19564.1 hypothetical protein WJ28_05190 [Burkholderia thailandensis]